MLAGRRGRGQAAAVARGSASTRRRLLQPPQPASHHHELRRFSMVADEIDLAVHRGRSEAEWLSAASDPVRRILEGALAPETRELSVDDGALLLAARGADAHATLAAANELRRKTVGERVTYVVNRNINFTNVCVKRCGFCAFSRTGAAAEGYYLPLEEILRRANEAWTLGATEVCVQAGLPPNMDGGLYPSLCRAIKSELPDVHIHGFSPEEVRYGAKRSGLSVEAFLRELIDAGVGSLPGTSAEILDDDVRHQLAAGRLTTAQWTEVVSTAHRLGLNTTSTVMYGHLETYAELSGHLATIRSIQRKGL